MSEEGSSGRRARFRRLVEASADAMVVVDAEGVIRYVNPAGAALFGRSQAELVGADFGFTVGRDGPAELDIRRPDGSTVVAELREAPIRWKGHDARLVSLRDVTARREAEEALRESQERLEQSRRLEAIGQLAGGIAHDFNNLLTGISGYATFLIEGLDVDPDDLDGEEIADLRSMAGKIQRIARRAGDLTRQLLAFSRKQVARPREVDLGEVVRETEALLRRVIGEHITVEVETPDEPVVVLADPGRLEQVLLNLATNARDAMPEGGTLWIVVEPEPGIEGGPDRAEGPHVRLTIRDTGEGMKEEIRARAFEPFFTTKDRGEGTGLGLAAVYGEVEQAGGFVELESEPGEGTAVDVHLPRIEAEPATVEEAEVVRREGVEGGETILVVEDAGAVRGLVVATLVRRGYEVLEAPEPDRAIELAESHHGPIHLLLTDVVLPGMSGPEVAEEVRRRRPRTAILFMSGYAEETVLRHGEWILEETFLEKPFQPDELARAVRRVLDA